MIQRTIHSLLFVSIYLACVVQANGQRELPTILNGTWKADNENIYEHWDILNSAQMKGISYSLEEKGMRVSEYLDISSTHEHIIYTASVLNQNNGASIPFQLIQSDSLLVFENKEHDFPQQIIYSFTSDASLKVTLKGASGKSYSYKMQKIITTPIESETSDANPNFDFNLATKLGGDDYGMKSYMLVILKTGSARIDDNSLIQEYFRGHLDNINRLVQEGKLVVAGPLGKNELAYRGIFILTISNLEEAEQLLQTDPAIREGLLDYEIIEWYGSAALPMYLEYSDKIWKSKP